MWILIDDFWVRFETSWINGYYSTSELKGMGFQSSGINGDVLHFDPFDNVGIATVMVMSIQNRAS